MEFLKDVFGDKALTYDDLQNALSDKTDIKIGNIANGYVTQEEYNTLKLQYESTNTQLTEANSKLNGYDPEWQQKSEQAKIDAENKIIAYKLSNGIENAVKSYGAKDIVAVKAHLDTSKIKLDGDKIIGIDEQLKSIKKDYDYLFESEKPKMFSSSTRGIQIKDKNKLANEALREIFKKG